MHWCCSFVMFLGRLSISAVFLLSGVSKFLDYNATASFMEAKGLPFVTLFFVLAALLEVLGGVALVLGYKTRFAATLLLLYLIPVTLIFHDFWDVEGVGQQLQIIMFFKNLAIFGGLLLLVASGAGKCSCDNFCSNSKSG